MEGDRGTKRTWCRAGIDESLQVNGGWSTFGFVGKRRCFLSDVGSYRKPGKEKQWCVLWGELRKACRVLEQLGPVLKQQESEQAPKVLCW